MSYFQYYMIYEVSSKSIDFFSHDIERKPHVLSLSRRSNCVENKWKLSIYEAIYYQYHLIHESVSKKINSFLKISGDSNFIENWSKMSSNNPKQHIVGIICCMKFRLNRRNMPSNNPKQDIVNIVLYKKFHPNPPILSVTSGNHFCRQARAVILSEVNWFCKLTIPNHSPLIKICTQNLKKKSIKTIQAREWKPSTGRQTPTEGKT